MPTITNERPPAWHMVVPWTHKSPKWHLDRFSCFCTVTSARNNERTTLPSGVWWWIKKRCGRLDNRNGIRPVKKTMPFIPKVVLWNGVAVLCNLQGRLKFRVHGRILRGAVVEAAADVDKTLRWQWQGSSQCSPGRRQLAEISSATRSW